MKTETNQVNGFYVDETRKRISGAFHFKKDISSGKLIEESEKRIIISQMSRLQIGSSLSVPN